MDLREINEKIWFQGRTTHDTKLDPSYVGQGTDQEGPGWYFTDHAEDASRYAAPNGSVLMGHLNIRKLASSEKPADRKTIAALLERAPDLEHTLTNWDENPKRALKAAIDSILKYNPLEKDAFQQVWIDFYKTEPIEYLDALVALGYDGHVPTGSWGAQHHFVLYNAKAFRLEDSYPYAEGHTTSDAIQTPISERHDYGPSWSGSALAAYEKTVQTPGGKPVEVFKNPSRKELKEIAQHDEVRAFLVGNDLIVWNTYGAIHHQMSEQIQIPDDSVALNMNVHQDGKSYYVRVSDWTRRSSWFHNPEIVPYIMNHPALKLVRDRGPEFEIGFFDENIVGRWDELKEDERDTAGVDDTDYPYYHVTDHPNKPTVRKDYTKFTGNKRHDWEPYGIFLFPKGEEVVTIGYGERKWRWDAKLKPGTKILDINVPGTMSKLLHEAKVTPYSVISRIGGSMGYYGSRLSDLMEAIYAKQEDAGEKGDWSTIVSRLRGAQESENFADAFKEQLAPIYAGWKEWLMPEGYVDTDRGWAALVAHFSKDKADSITKFLKSQGDVISDKDGNAFYDGEPQILVVNPNVIQWLKREKNSADTEKEFEVYPLMVGSVTASPDSLRREFRDLYESEEFYDDEFLDYYDGEPEKARQWFQMAYEGFKRRMENWTWGPHGVRCWRVITVPKGKKVNLKELGGSWSYRKEAAHSWYGTGGKKFTFEAEIPEAAIDREVTLRNNLVNLDEEEIRTYDHQKIYLYAVLNSKGERVKEFDPPLETQTGAVDLFGGSMVGEKAEAGGFYFWDDQDGPLYQTPPNEDKGSDQRTMPQQPTDWPSLKLETAKKTKWPTEDDYEDAWAVMKHAYGMEPTDDYEQQDLEDMGEKWHASLRKARMKTWKVKDAAKKFQIMDHGRRLEGEELENPIIVAVVGKQHIVLDGSHRLITKFERGAETIDALMVPMNWADELTAMDGEMLATVTSALEFLSAPAIWNGRSEIEAGVRVGPKTYVAKKDLKTFVDTYVQVADEGLKDEIDAASTDDDFPEAFYQQNQDMIYFNDLTFRTYRPNDMLFETIMMALLTRRPLPQKVRVILYSPARDKTYLVKDLLQKGEHLLQSSAENDMQPLLKAARYSQMNPDLLEPYEYHQDSDKIEEIKEAMSNGDLPPIVAAGDEKGAKILDGHHRWRAALALDRDAVDVILIPSELYWDLKEQFDLEDLNIAEYLIKELKR